MKKTRSSDKNHLQSGLENMEQAVSTLKKYFKRTVESEVNNECDRTTGPQLGFKVSYDEGASELRAKVIGARQLPTEYGSFSPSGYLVKVDFFVHLIFFSEMTPLKNFLFNSLYLIS